MTKIRVLVADDSAFMRKVISDILESDSSIEVVSRVRNGEECLNKVKEVSPDVITLDVEMPVMDGLATLERLQEEYPVPVVMLSNVTKEGADATVRALQLGAFDFVNKPSGAISLDIHKVGQNIVEMVKQAAESRKQRNSVKVIEELKSDSITPLPSLVKKRTTTRVIRQEVPSTKKLNVEQRIERSDGSLKKLVLLGTSTGGPRALQTLLPDIPVDFPAPILIVQHMPPGFTKSLAQRLDTLCAITVKEAEQGEEILAGTAYIAPGGYHMEVEQQSNGSLYIKLHQAEPKGGHRPSVDVMFMSASQLKRIRQWAVILTGMGADGTEGLQNLKASVQVTGLIEDQSTCVVFGMPRAAIHAGLADYVVPLNKMADTLVRLVT
ncbi:protein-glutamate methylesterase/protein-glutamine glutaminase [Brevibacillus daliensis]|uniref:protein-glutamate methylesterase/protein-glutamine glutaminase n=1 Tax=Brevibacillus daliensis TaxID=2892995 RepID=UPI001E4BF4CB|nr:chemotaxis response regulator protein-glutamate methylesterase [Brevibacillus daliensis]